MKEKTLLAVLAAFVMVLIPVTYYINDYVRATKQFQFSLIESGVEDSISTSATIYLNLKISNSSTYSFSVSNIKYDLYIRETEVGIWDHLAKGTIESFYVSPESTTTIATRITINYKNLDSITLTEFLNFLPRGVLKVWSIARAMKLKTMISEHL